MVSNPAAERGARATAVPLLLHFFWYLIARRPWPTATSLERLQELSSFVLHLASRRRPVPCPLFRVVRASGRPTVSAAARGPRLIEASGARRRAAAAARRPAAAPIHNPAAPRSNQAARIHKDSRAAALTSSSLLLDRPRDVLRLLLARPGLRGRRLTPRAALGLDLLREGAQGSPCFGCGVLRELRAGSAALRVSFARIYLCALAGWADSDRFKPILKRL